MTRTEEAPQKTKTACADCGQPLWQYEVENYCIMGEGSHCTDCYRPHVEKTLKALGAYAS